MLWYVYIIQSEVDGVYYKGETADPTKRIITHNQGGNTSTRSRIPWKLVYLKAFESRSLALKEEKRLKRCNKKYLNWLIAQSDNFMNDTIALSRLA
jgi:putative endonuclease